MKTILVLDNDACVRALVRVILSNGYTVLESASAEQAIQRFQEHHGRIDLLIVDVLLPKSSGPRVATELLSLIPGLQVLLMYSYPPSMWSDQMIGELNDLPSGAVTKLEKPFFRQRCEARSSR